MTRDFVEQLKEACDREGCAYLIVIAYPKTEKALVSHDFANWESKRDRTAIDDLHDIIDLVEGWEEEDNKT